jgi:hypothetical protein
MIGSTFRLREAVYRYAILDYEMRRARSPRRVAALALELRRAAEEARATVEEARSDEWSDSQLLETLVPRAPAPPAQEVTP